MYLGEAAFSGRDTVEVGGKTLRFAKAVIATGARAAAPDIPGLAEVGYLTNETVFSLTELPARLAVIGAGPIGSELSQAFRRFGSECICWKRPTASFPGGSGSRRAGRAGLGQGRPEPDKEVLDHADREEGLGKDHSFRAGRHLRQHRGGRDPGRDRQSTERRGTEPGDGRGGVRPDPGEGKRVPADQPTAASTPRGTSVPPSSSPTPRQPWPRSSSRTPCSCAAARPAA